MKHSNSTQKLRSQDKKHGNLVRRDFLRSAGVSIALPCLPSLVWRQGFAAQVATVSPGTTSSGAPLRMAFMCVPNGVQQDHWFPSADFQLGQTLQPLQSLKAHFQVIGGLDHINATPGPDGAGDHARAGATFLTGMRARKTAGSDIHVGVSIDQVAAQHYGNQTRLPSLELTSDLIRNSGGCDSGYACAYQYNMAWSSATTPVTPEPNPRLVFERLFGAGNATERAKNYRLRQESDRSVLDFVLDEAKSVQLSLGAYDKRKFDEYLSVIRETEQQLIRTERFAEPPRTHADAPVDSIPTEFSDYMDIMYDMLLLAFQSDSTRIGTLLLSYDGSNRTFPSLGIAEGHHFMTHNQRVPEYAAKVARIDQYYINSLSRFLQRMQETQDVDGNSLLHNSMIVYGGAIADGNRHTHENLPVILAGHAGGAIKTGRFLQASKQPMSNLFVSMLNLCGVPVEQFGDSTGYLAELA
ncbi:MAG: DUF1552 domain-containing protein [Planctomycetales bacterium]|nr:DUF1552 domain-containing protein [Planctomycetales bacterium]